MLLRKVVAALSACLALSGAAVAASGDNQPVEKPTGQVTDVKSTDNNDNVRCPGSGDCSPDGKYRASVRDLRVAAQPGHYLRNAVLTCNGEGCPWSEWQGPFLQGGGIAATAHIKSWSKPVTWVLQADEFAGSMPIVRGPSGSLDQKLVLSEHRTQRIRIAALMDTPAGQLTDVQGTDNNDHVSCRGGDCSPDGKWRASVRDLRLTAPAGYYLRNARLSCAGGAGCAFTETQGPFMQGDGAAVTAHTKAWNLPVTWILQADLFKRS